MSALTSLLARDQVVPVRKIEEALQKQVVSGGEIATVLLELEALAENTLAAYQAALHNLLPATRDEVMRVARDVIRLVPREVAEKHRIVPLAVDGRALLVASAAPLSTDLEGQIGFLLGYELLGRIVCDVRIAAALQHHYGVEPSARNRRLIDRLRHREAGEVPYVAPAQSAKVDRSSLAELPKKPSMASWLDEDEDDPPPALPPRRSSLPPPSDGRSTDPNGFVRPAIAPPSTAPAASSALPAANSIAAALGQATAPAPVPSEPPPLPEDPTEVNVSPFASARTTSPGLPRLPDPGELRASLSSAEAARRDSSSAGSVYASRAPSSTGEPAVSAVPARVLGVGVRRSSRPPAPSELPSAAVTLPSAAALPSLTSRTSTPGAKPKRPAPSSAEISITQHAIRKLRGPLTAAAAVKLLEEASGRDDVLHVFFAFARQFFDYAAMFAVSGDIAEGRDAFGSGASVEAVKRLAIPLEVPGSFAVARKSRSPRVSRMDFAELDAMVLADLGRPKDVVALILPLVLRERTVLFLYGDRGSDPFDLSDVPELIAFVPRVTAAIERAILRRKKPGFARTDERPAATPRNELKAAAKLVGSLPPAAPRAPRDGDRWSSPPARRSLAPSTPPAAEPPAVVPPAVVSPAPASPQVAGAAPTPAMKPSPGYVRSDEKQPVSSNEPPGTSATVSAAAPRSLADVIASTALSDASTEFSPGAPELPSASDVAALAQPPVARTARRPPTLRQMVGIPRTAPPPPASDAFDLGMLPIPGAALVPAIPGGALVPVLDEPRVTSIREGRDTFPDGLLPASVRATEPAPPPAKPDDDEPELVVGSADASEFDAADLEAGESDAGRSETGTDDSPFGGSAPPMSSARREASVLPRTGAPAARETYLYKDAAVDIVGRRKPARRSDRPAAPPAASSGAEPPGEPSVVPGRRIDPRREEDDGSTASERVRVPTLERSERATANVRPRAPTMPPPGAPSVIVDMGEGVTQLVQDLIHAGPDDEVAVVDALLRLGTAPLPMLAQAFPGPLWFDRRKPHRKVPRGRDVSAIARALHAYRERAVPYVASLLGSTDPERRYYATMLATEFLHGGLVDALVQRVFDDDEVVRKLAETSLVRHRGLPEMQEALVFLRRTARIRGKDGAKRLRAIAALGGIRDASALRLLVDLLEDDDGGVVHAAHLALVDITCEDLGASSRKWSAWAERNERRHRIEWLMDALTHGDEALRTAAGEDLKALTQQYFGFHPTTSKKEREVVQQKYRTWWETAGRRIHTGS